MYRFSEMEEMIREMEEKRARERLVFEARLTLEKTRRAGGHKARTLIASPALAEYIGRRVRYEVYYEGEKIREGEAPVKEKTYKGRYRYGAVRITLPVDYAGKKVTVVLYP